jgi:hypothetical protein
MTFRRLHRHSTESGRAVGASHPTAFDNHTGDVARGIDLTDLQSSTVFDVDLATRSGMSLRPSMMWRILTPLIAIVAFLLGTSLDLGLPRLLGHSSEALTGAAVLGASIAFTGIAVSGFFLLISRVNALAAVDDSVAAARRQVARGESHATAVRAYRDTSGRTSTQSE